MRWLANILVALAIAFAALSPSWAQAPLSAAEFRELVITHILTEAPGLVIERRDPLGFEITAPEDSNFTDRSVNLDRAFQEYLTDPSQLEAIVARWTRVAIDAHEGAALDRIVSILRTEDSIASYEQAMRAREQFSPIVRRPFLGDLIEVMAFDGADSFQMATEAAINELGISEEEAWALTDQNLVNRIGAIARHAVGGERELAYLTGENGLTPSLLALPDVCVREQSGLFLVLDRNVVLFGRSTNTTSRRQFERVVANLVPQSLSRTPFACINGELTALSSSER